VSRGCRVAANERGRWDRAHGRLDGGCIVETAASGTVQRACDPSQGLQGSLLSKHGRGFVQFGVKRGATRNRTQCTKQGEIGKTSAVCLYAGDCTHSREPAECVSRQVCRSGDEGEFIDLISPGCTIAAGCETGMDGVVWRIMK
jgi:hypothetical protein